MEGRPPPPSLSTAPPVPTDWARYEVLDLLGKGGMGAVYRARDRRLGRIVALKFIREEDPQLAQRFMQEARAQARIEHDDVCKVYEVGEVEGHAFIAMQFIDGRPLSVIQQQMSLEDKVGLLATVAEAVHAAHRQGIVHRDLKPSNIMVERGEDGRLRPVVMDFGLAHDTAASQALTQAGALLGTPQYMPPEQARGEHLRIDRRSDVYSLGAMLYELLTGQPPFGGDTVTSILLQVLDVEPTPPRQRVPSVPADLETITLKCLQKEPTQRYDSARALAEDLRRYLDGEPILGRRMSLRYRALRWTRRRPVVVALMALVLLGSSVFGRAWLQAQREARLAEQLGQDVKEMELFMRVAYMMPLYDIQPEKEVVRQRMREIEQRAQRLSTQRRGPAEYALGRGHMALREYPAALARLHAAWNSGYQGPETHYAFGRTLGELYKLKLEEVERVSDAAYRQRERQKLEAEYLVPAREHLRLARGIQLESPLYVGGLLALYSQRHQEAVQKAEETLKQRPWQYEAQVLAGDAWSAMGMAAQDQRRYPEAQKNFDQAIGRYQAASDLARSDSGIYEAEASTWANVILNSSFQGADPRAAYEHGRLACERAIQLSIKCTRTQTRRCA